METSIGSWCVEVTEIGQPWRCGRWVVRDRSVWYAHCETREAAERKGRRLMRERGERQVRVLRSEDVLQCA